MSNYEDEKLADLLTDQALHGLRDDEKRELKNLAAKYPELDETELERAAAALQLTEAMKPEALPTHLRSKVIADAEEFFGPVKANNVPLQVVPFPARKIKRDYWQMAGWYVAAACLALAVIAAWPQLKKMIGGTSKEITIAELRNDFEKKAADKVMARWSTTEYPDIDKVRGDVMWSNETQQGYMRFTNLPQNDPHQNVYQLWIFDANQDEKYPIDGGIFDVVRNSGELIVPIQPKLKVGRPTLFAVTIEKPGGVVVSKRDKLILTAKIE